MIMRLNEISSAVLVGLAVVGLTACGGGTNSVGSTMTQQLPGATSQATNVPAQIAEANNAPEVTQVPVANSTESVNNATDTNVIEETTNTLEPQPSPAVVENLPAAIEETALDNQNKPYVPDQVVLAGAANVGCDADAAVFQSTMLELINNSRIKARMCGTTQHDVVHTLGWNPSLVEAAVNHGRDMATHNFFSHDGSDGLSVADRADAVGYVWRAVGENIAAGQTDHAEVHQGWLDSPAHCRNIMNELFTEVGAACVTDPDTNYGTYWVVVFGDAK